MFYCVPKTACKEKRNKLPCMILHNSGLSLEKTLHVWLPHAKTTFYYCGARFRIARHIITCDQREITYWLENNRFINDDIESQKNLACFQTNGTDVEGEVTLFMGIFQKVDKQGRCLNQFKVFFAISTLVCLLPNTT